MTSGSVQPTVLAIITGAVLMLMGAVVAHVSSDGHETLSQRQASLEKEMLGSISAMERLGAARADAQEAIHEMIAATLKAEQDKAARERERLKEQFTDLEVNIRLIMSKLGISEASGTRNE